MAPTSPAQPGYTDTEKSLLEAMAAELLAFTIVADWDQQLPFAVSRTFVLEQLGNPVRFTMKLYRHVSKSTNQEQIKLLFDITIQGTGKEQWASADSGFFLGHGSAAQVATAVQAFHQDIRPVQAQLANDYRATFYNS